MDRYNGVTNQGQRSDFEGRPVNTDPVRFSIEQGDAYRSSFTTLNLVAGESTIVMIDPSANGRVAMKGKLFVICTQDVKIEFREGVDASANGDAQGVFNFNRIDPKTSAAEVYNPAALTNTGTKYAPDIYLYVGYGGVGSQVTTITPYEGGDEFSAFLHPDKKYGVIITNLHDSDAAKVTADLRLVEEPNYPLSEVV